jgi:metal-responsive CopG/Arc/MetJ family transcriptional regulator
MLHIMKIGATLAPMNNTAKTHKNRDRTSLRLDGELVAMIDKARIKRVGVVSRNTWIAEAIQEKLAREVENGSELAQIAQGRG